MGAGPLLELAGMTAAGASPEPDPESARAVADHRSGTDST